MATFLWNDAEDVLLRRQFPHYSNADLPQFFPDRTVFGIIQRARKLHLVKTKDFQRAYLEKNRRGASFRKGHRPWNVKEKVRLTCSVCGGDYLVPPCHVKGSHTCSADCRTEYARTLTGKKRYNYTGLVPWNCDWCGALFGVYPSEVKAHKRHFCSMECVGAHATWRQAGRRSSLEVAVEGVLRSLGEVFLPNYRIGSWLVDFYFPLRCLVLEVDGDYWHAKPEVVERDRRKDRSLLANGYATVRLTEKAVRRDVWAAVASVGIG